MSPSSHVNDRNRLQDLIASGSFLFKRLELSGIDNQPVLSRNDPKMADEEICLFHRDVPDGDTYLEMLDRTIEKAVAERQAMPVARFADGEYAFYRFTLGCNGLYRQAESVDHIKRAMSFHIEALAALAQSGWLAPLIFPGNTHGAKKGILSFFRKNDGESSALSFLDFLYARGIALERDHYMPFYVVYAYLVSKTFASLIDGRKLCIVNSEFHAETVMAWFAEFSSRPEISFVEIPESYVATRWPELKEKIFSRVPAGIDLFLTGAGVGALPLCVDLARSFSVPAIDAGHVLNMMNGREDKSNGPRLYTLRKK